MTSIVPNNTEMKFFVYMHACNIKNQILLIFPKHEIHYYHLILLHTIIFITFSNFAKHKIDYL